MSNAVDALRDYQRQLDAYFENESERVRAWIRSAVFQDPPMPARPVLTLRERYCTGTCAMLEAEPHLHDSGCPVAPVPGLHGGMRVAPVGDWRRGDEVWEADRMGWTASDRLMRRSMCELGRASDGFSDSVLMAFYMPPAHPSDEPVGLPVENDPDLDAVLDVATRHPEGWR